MASHHTIVIGVVRCEGVWLHTEVLSLGCLIKHVFPRFHSVSSVDRVTR